MKNITKTLLLYSAMTAGGIFVPVASALAQQKTSVEETLQSMRTLNTEFTTLETMVSETGSHVGTLNAESYDPDNEQLYDRAKALQIQENKLSPLIENSVRFDGQKDDRVYVNNLLDDSENGTSGFIPFWETSRDYYDGKGNEIGDMIDGLDFLSKDVEKKIRETANLESIPTDKYPELINVIETLRAKVIDIKAYAKTLNPSSFEHDNQELLNKIDEVTSLFNETAIPKAWGYSHISSEGAVIAIMDDFYNEMMIPLRESERFYDGKRDKINTWLEEFGGRAKVSPSKIITPSNSTPNVRVTKDRSSRNAFDTYLTLSLEPSFMLSSSDVDSLASSRNLVMQNYVIGLQLGDHWNVQIGYVRARGEFNQTPKLIHEEAAAVLDAFGNTLQSGYIVDIERTFPTKIVGDGASLKLKYMFNGIIGFSAEGTYLDTDLEINGVKTERLQLGYPINSDISDISNFTRNYGENLSHISLGLPFEYDLGKGWSIRAEPAGTLMIDSKELTGKVTGAVQYKIPLGNR